MSSFATPTAAPKAAPAKTVTPAKVTPPPARTTARALPAAAPLQARALAAPALRGAAPVRRPAAAAPSAVAAALDTVLHVVSDSLLADLSQQAHAFVGFPLLTLLLGYDPFTHEPRPFTSENLVEALLAFDKDTQELYHVVRSTNALAKVGQLFESQAARHNLGMPRVNAVLHDMVKIGKEKHVTLLFNPLPLLEPLADLADSVTEFVKAVTPPLFEIILPLLGERGTRLLRILNQGKATFDKITANPQAFLRNLVAGLRLGFDQFKAKALGYLGISFTTWLLSAFKNEKLAIPKQFDGPGLFQLGLSLLHLDLASLKRKLASRLGPGGDQKVQVLETAGGLAHTLVTQGPGALGQELLDMAKSQFSQLTHQVIDGVRTWLYEKLVVVGLAKLASMLSPASALLEALRETYETIAFYIEKADKFAALLDTIIGAITDIANRVLTTAANKVESTLAQSLTLALDLLFRLLGLKGVPEQVRTQILKARQWIDKTIDKYLDKFIEMAVKLFNKGKAAVKDAVHSVKTWLGFDKEFTVNKEPHHVFVADEHGKPQLMIASVPKGYKKFLDDSKLELTKGGQSLTPEVEKALAAIEILGHEVDALLAPQPPAGAAAGAAAPAVDEKAVNDKLGEIAEKCMVVMAARHPKGLNLQATPIYSGQTTQQFSLGMHMPYLTSGFRINSKNKTVLVSIGSEPDDVNTTYDTSLNLRGTKSHSNYYVRGHLLNHNLHGPGKWENMTPLSRAGNKNHLNGIETFLKDLAWSDAEDAEKATQATNTPQQATHGYYYSVVPRYGRPMRHDLVQLASGRTLIDGDKTSPNEGLTYIQFVRLVAAEQFVPLSLTCAWQRVKATGETIGDAKSVTIDNPIEQNSLDDYFAHFPNQAAGPIYSLNKKKDADEVYKILRAGNYMPERQADRIFTAMTRGVKFLRSDSVGSYVEKEAKADPLSNAADLAEAKQVTGLIKKLVGKSLNFGLEKPPTTPAAAAATPTT